MTKSDPFADETSGSDYFESAVHFQRLAIDIEARLKHEGGFILVTGDPAPRGAQLARALAFTGERGGHAIVISCSEQATFNGLIANHGGALAIAIAKQKAGGPSSGPGASVLVLEDAERLSDKVLEELCRSSTAQHGRRPPLVLLAADALAHRLARPPLQAIKPAFVAHYRNQRLSEKEVDAFLQYQLKAAGSAHLAIFPSAVVELIVAFSSGDPAVVNELARGIWSLAQRASSKAVPANELVGRRFAELLEPYLESDSVNGVGSQTLPQAEQTSPEPSPSSEDDLPLDAVDLIEIVPTPATAGLAVANGSPNEMVSAAQASEAEVGAAARDLIPEQGVGTRESDLAPTHRGTAQSEPALTTRELAALGGVMSAIFSATQRPGAPMPAVKEGGAPRANLGAREIEASSNEAVDVGDVPSEQIVSKPVKTTSLQADFTGLELAPGAPAVSRQAQSVAPALPPLRPSQRLRRKRTRSRLLRVVLSAVVALALGAAAVHGLHRRSIEIPWVTSFVDRLLMRIAKSSRFEHAARPIANALSHDSPPTTVSKAVEPETTAPPAAALDRAVAPAKSDSAPPDVSPLEGDRAAAALPPTKPDSPAAPRGSSSAAAPRAPGAVVEKASNSEQGSAPKPRLQAPPPATETHPPNAISEPGSTLQPAPPRSNNAVGDGVVVPEPTKAPALAVDSLAATPPSTTDASTPIKSPGGSETVVATAPPPLADGAAPAPVAGSTITPPAVVALTTPTAPAPVEPVTAPELAPAPLQAGKSSSDEASNLLLERGDQLLALGDIFAARRFFERAEEGGDARAALRVGKTYDPVFLQQIGAMGMRGDPAKATVWYKRAIATGDAEAEVRLFLLRSKYSE